MKLVSLNCNSCGAPLDVPAKAKYVTCIFCESKLSVQRTGSAWSTEVLEELQATTQALASDVKELKKRSDIEQLDREWRQFHSEILVRNKDGSTSVPSVIGSVFVMVIASIFGVIWFGFTNSRINAPGIFPFLAVVFILFGIVQGMLGISKANKYQAAHRKYQRRRRDLVSQ